MKTKMNNLFLIVVFTAVIVTITMSVTKYAYADHDHHHSQKDHHNHHHSQKDHHNHHHSQKDHHNHHHSQKDHPDKNGHNGNALTVANLTSVHTTTPVENNLTSVHTTTPVENNLTSIHNNAPAEIKNEIGGIVNATNLISTPITTPVHNNVIAGPNTTSEKHTLNPDGFVKIHKSHSSKHNAHDIFSESSGQTISGKNDQNNATNTNLSQTRTGYNPIDDNAGNLGNSNSGSGMLLPFM